MFGAGIAQDPVDLNGDGNADLLWYGADQGESVAWLMDGTSPVGGGAMLRHPSYKVIGTADLNGDGKSDLIWYDEATGETSAWLMNGSTFTSGQVFLRGTRFKAIGAPDLNGDGKSDLLWRNDSTGQVVAWIMDGSTLVGGGNLLTDPALRIVALPDLNGDGKTDLVWYNEATGQSVAWLMDGATVTLSVPLLTHPSFRVVAAPDLNGDGKSDLLWYSPSTGQTVAWLMDGQTFIGGAQLLADPNFKTIGTPDLNGDGKADLLWYSAATGQTIAWLMDGLNLLGGGSLLTHPYFQVVAAPDLNADGKADLIWYSPENGQTVVWIMDGMSLVSGGVLLTDASFRLGHSGVRGIPFDFLTGSFDGGISNAAFHTRQPSALTITTTETNLTIRAEQFLDGTCLFTAPLGGIRQTVGGGTYQCSDFSSGAWSLIDMQRVDQGDVYVSLIKDGTSFKRFYGMSPAGSATSREPLVPLDDFVGAYEGISTGGPFGTQSGGIGVEVAGNKLTLTISRFFSGTCRYTADIVGNRKSIANGVYQCSDFSTGTWNLLEMRRVGGGDLHVSVLANGAVIRAYGYQ